MEIEKKTILKAKFKKLKDEAGTHSPSIFTIKQKLPEIEVKVDACFLSNPHATDLFIKYFNEEVIETGKIRELIEFYPSQNSVIAEVLAPFLKTPSEQIFIGNGAIEIIQAVIHNFTRKKILINIPTFSSYYEFVKPGVEVIYNKLEKERNFALNTDQYLIQVKKERPDTIVLINPNNPDGNFIPITEIKKILQEISFVETIIIDESFIHFAYEDADFKPISIAEMVQANPNLIVIKSMSKDFGIAGIRAGYSIMNEKRVSHLLSNGYLWNTNGITEFFFRLYTRADFAYNYNEVRIRYIQDTIDFIKKLSEISEFKVYPGRANFVLIEILKQNLSGFDFVVDLLLNYGIYVRTTTDKIGLEGNFIRLASRTREENAYVIESFKDYFLKNVK